MSYGKQLRRQEKIKCSRSCISGHWYDSRTSVIKWTVFIFEISTLKWQQIILWRWLLLLLLLLFLRRHYGPMRTFASLIDFSQSVSIFWRLLPICNLEFINISLYIIPLLVFFLGGGRLFRRLPWELLLNTWFTFLLLSILLTSNPINRIIQTNEGISKLYVMKMARLQKYKAMLTTLQKKAKSYRNASNYTPNNMGPYPITLQSASTKLWKSLTA